MTNNLTPAQQAQTQNRDPHGRWKAKTHADVDDSADVLGVDHREIGALSQGQQRTLEQFSAERAAWHDDQAQAYRGSIDEMGGGLSNVHPGDTDAYVDNIDGVNHHEVASLANRAPISATYAEVHRGSGPEASPRVSAWFDRDGNRRQADVSLDLEQPESVELPFWAGSVGGPVGATSPTASVRNLVDLETARDFSDQWAQVEADELRESGQEEKHLPNEATGEITCLRRRATLREFDPDSDDAFDRDHIEAWVNGAAVNSGTATTELPQTYPGELADGDIAFVQDDGHTHILSNATMARENVTVYTDAQRALDTRG